MTNEVGSWIPRTRANAHDKFPPDYLFELDEAELDDLRTKVSSTNLSAEPGTDKAWPGWAERDPAGKRLRILSLDRMLPLVDETRGARARLTHIVAAAKRQKHCFDPWWHLPANR